MIDRKNIFLIARKGHEGLEDQLTELLAFLWQEEPELLAHWLKKLRVDLGAELEVGTQRGVTDGRLDIAINGVDAAVIVESKLHSTTSYRQMEKYIAHARQAVSERRTRDHPADAVARELA